MKKSLSDKIEQSAKITVMIIFLFLLIWFLFEFHSFNEWAIKKEENKIELRQDSTYRNVYYGSDGFIYHKIPYIKQLITK